LSFHIVLSGWFRDWSASLANTTQSAQFGSPLAILVNASASLSRCSIAFDSGVPVA
jgi:hypothetical protein